MKLILLLNLLEVTFDTAAVIYATQTPSPGFTHCYIMRVLFHGGWQVAMTPHVPC